MATATLPQTSPILPFPTKRKRGFQMNYRGPLPEGVTRLHPPADLGVGDSRLTHAERFGAPPSSEMLVLLAILSGLSPKQKVKARMLIAMADFERPCAETARARSIMERF